MNTFEKWFIAVGTVCVALSLLGFTTLVSERYIQSTSQYIWVFDSWGYFKGINTNLATVNGLFTATDYNIVNHTSWNHSITDLISFGTACSYWFRSLANVLIWLIQVVVITPFKMGMSGLALVTGLLGINLQGSSWQWLYDFINGVASLNLQFIDIS